MKQTAVEWLQNHLIVHFSEIEQQIRFKGLFEKAKDLEKRHIMDANTAGVNCGLYGYKNAEEYYKKTFTEPVRIANDNINVTNE